MKKIKKNFIMVFISILTIISAIIGFTACGSNDNNDDIQLENYSFVTEEVEPIDRLLYILNGHYYVLYEESLTWKEAEVKCESLGGHLVTITSEEENKFIRALIKKYNCKDMSSYHIGGFKTESSWEWITEEPWDFKSWSSGQPDGSGDKLCFWHDENGWDDLQNGKYRYFICEWEKKEDIGKQAYYLTKTINTVEELKNIANTDNDYVLSSDLELPEEENWDPIEGFSGTLNGNGHCISNLTINSVNQANIGLFGTLHGSVRNLNILDAQISARGDAGYAGILAGTSKRKISNVTVSGNISTTYYNYVGGLVGYSDCGEISNCVNRANVVGSNFVGGIVGSVLVNVDNSIINCINESTLTGKERIGGIAGYVTCVTSNATYQITNNENKGVITGVSQVGGIFGEVYGFYQGYGSHDYNSYFSMSVLANSAEVNGSSTGNNVGGLIGKASRLTLLTTCDNTANVTGGTCVGGFVGYAPDTNIKAIGSKNNNRITGKGKIGGFAGQAGVIEHAINNGEIVSTGILIEDGNNRAYVGGIAGFCTGLIGCENNIDIKVGNNGDFIGGLAGYVVVSESNKVNNNINRASVTGYNRTGGIAGYVTCVTSNATYQITNNENKGVITGVSQVGGIFGEVYGFYQGYGSHDYNSYFSMSVLNNSAEVTGSSTGNDTGGLIGKASRLTLLTTCDNTANVTGGICVGGFVGYAPDTNIKATGTINNVTVTGSYRVGGFAGQAGVIEYAINSGKVIATGKNENGNTYLGGIAGHCGGAIGCVNNEDISLSNGGKFVGGIAGYVTLSNVNALHDNVNYGKIQGADYVGGVVGYTTCITSNATYRLTDNKNVGKVQGGRFIGGITGYIYGFYQGYGSHDYNSYFEIVNCTNEAEVVGTEKVGGICGGYERLKTDANLMDTNTTLYGEKLGQ